MDTREARSRKSVLSVSRPIGRPDRQFYAKSNAFGRFGMRWFRPVVMSAPHSHGHIELNWLSSGHMDYVFDGRPVRIHCGHLVAFWASIPHQAVAIDYGENDDAQQCNIYLPLDAFLHIPHIDRLHEDMMGGAVLGFRPDAVGSGTLHRWYGDYRSGDPERQDILKTEIASMLRRSTLIGWDTLMPAWIEPTIANPRQAPPVRYVVAMVRYILENLAEPLSVDDVAKVVGLHPNYALNLFTSVMRVPIRKFVIRMRLVRARALLFESNLSIANVAFQSGFNSLSQFYAHFGRAYGVTPMELRRHLIR
ncbi:MAG: helix-turn-helix domain-containing protein [Alphaproteobacteria bacterium]|nr:helix-turn-helix domain-containing protein [Alphaproteobacteria bacterium]